MKDYRQIDVEALQKLSVDGRFNDWVQDTAFALLACLAPKEDFYGEPHPAITEFSKEQEKRNIALNSKLDENTPKEECGSCTACQSGEPCVVNYPPPKDQEGWVGGTHASICECGNCKPPKDQVSEPSYKGRQKPTLFYKVWQENYAQCQGCGAKKKKFCNCTKTTQQLQAEILGRFRKEYFWHDPDCIFLNDEKSDECSCGLDEELVRAITQTAEAATKAERERILDSLEPMFDLDKDGWRLNNERNKALEAVSSSLSVSFPSTL